MKKLIGNLTTYLSATILLVYGLIYLLRNRFMPYHSEAVSLNWEEVNPAMQFLLIALMRAIAGGFISMAFAIFFLQYQFSHHKISWIPLLILILGTISMFCTSYAIMQIWFHTPGRPPIAIVIAGELLLIVGYIFNRKYLREPE